MERPHVFIGSSVEGLRIAEAVFACLSYETQPKLWTNQLFMPGVYPMETLEKQLRRHAFAVFVASPDDQILKRNELLPAMRDNLILEFGLFAGALGRRRTFFVCPTHPELDLPSDLLGVVPAKYDAKRAQKENTLDEISAAVQLPCQQIRELIRQEWSLTRKRDEEAARRALSSKKGLAIRHLYDVATEIRDSLIVLQRDVFAAFTYEKLFNNIKTVASKRVEEIAKAYQADASEVGVMAELEALSIVTTQALADLPFPRELAVGKRTGREMAVYTFTGALKKLLDGGGPLRHVEGEIASEVKGRLASVAERYAEWWEKHRPLIEGRTAQLQDALLRSGMEIASTDQAMSPDAN
jgi:hypothetical protein